LPRSTWGTALAHFGVGMTLFGIVSEAHWGLERIVALKPAGTTIIRHYHLTFEGVVPRDGPNYREQAAVFTVRRGDDVVATLHPSKRSFTARSSTTTEAALMTRGLSQLYISLGDVQNDGSVAVRIYHKPLVLLIWLGAVVMAFGGALSLSDRRLRVGAPRPAKSALAPAE
jgi:cytochrome c-type biogenesis protein CcmF